MPLQKLTLRPGINKESTSYANEGGYFACDKVRFRSGFAEKLGGWINQTAPTSTFVGTCRSLFNWITLVTENLLGLGTNQKFYVEYLGIYHDITPLASTVALPTNPFATTNGSYKVIVTTSANHDLTIGTWVTFTNSPAGTPVTVNGITLYAQATISTPSIGAFEVIETPTSTTFAILGSTVATGTGSGGGSSVTAALEIDAGSATYSSGLGWGSGPWGFGGWGIGSAISNQLRLWSQDNDQENLLINPRGGPIYYWVKDTSTWARAVTLNSYANTQAKHVTPATFLAAATTITVTDPTGIDTGSVITGTGIAAGTYVTTAYVLGSTSVPISAAATGGSSGNYTFSYAGRHVPNTTYQVATSSSGNFCIAFGSNPYNPFNFSETFDPLLVRWSDADNPFEWVPSTLNQSGETRLSYGSYVVASTDTRQEILIWTDAALFSMQYLGPPYVWGINLLMDNISIISPNAAITINNVTYWMGTDKFYMYSGRVETLPCTLRQYIFTDINTEQISQVVCGANQGYNEIWWFYPSSNSLTNDRYVVYNHLEQIWYYGNLPRSYWLDSPLRQYPMAAFGVQTSYLREAIDATTINIPVLNATTYPVPGIVTIDSEQIYYTGITSTSLTDCIRGYNGTTAASHIQYSRVAYEIPNQILNHEYGNDDRSLTEIRPIAAYIESSDFDIQDGQSFGYVWRILPDLTFNSSSSNSPSVTLTVKARQNSGTNYAPADSPTVQETSKIPIEQYTGQVYTRVRGRQMSFRLDSTELGVAWQMGMMRIDVRPDGRR